MVVLEQRGEDDYFTATKINSAFARHVSPFFKMTASNFLSLVTEKHQSSFLDAIRTAKTGNEVKGKARNIERTTLAESNSCLPIKRHFDWTIGLGKDGKIVLFGDRCTEKDMAERAQDAELIDFFQNAPIALHWLSGDGIVLWAMTQSAIPAVAALREVSVIFAAFLGAWFLKESMGPWRIVGASLVGVGAAVIRFS
jgi:hypothetical protein